MSLHELCCILTDSLQISTIDVGSAIPIGDLCRITSVGGALVSVGLPDGKVPIGIGELSVSATNMTCTNIGSKKEAMEMFDLAVKKGVRTWSELWSFPF